MNEICGDADADVASGVPVETGSGAIEDRCVALRAAGYECGDDCDRNGIGGPGGYMFVKDAERGTNEYGNQLELANVDLRPGAVCGCGRLNGTINTYPGRSVRWASCAWMGVAGSDGASELWPVKTL